MTRTQKETVIAKALSRLEIQKKLNVDGDINNLTPSGAKALSNYLAKAGVDTTQHVCYDGSVTVHCVGM